MNTLRKYEQHEKTNEIAEALELLPSCLDYMSMTSEEIKELTDEMQKLEFSTFNPQNSQEIIKTLSSEIDKIKNQEEIQCEEFRNMQKEMKKEIKQINEILTRQEQMIESLQQKNEKYELQKLEMIKIIDEQKNTISTQKNDILQLQQNKAENDHFQQEIRKEIEEHKNMIAKQGNIILTFEQKMEEYEQQRKEANIKIEEQNDFILKQEKLIQDFQESTKIQKNEFDKLQKQVSIIGERREISFYQGKEFDGIIEYLRKFTNGNVNNEIEITSSSVYGNYIPENVITFNKRTVYLSNNEKNPWLCINFKMHRVIPKKYSIMSSNYPKNHWHPRSWVIEGRNGTENWEKIDEQKDCPHLNGYNITHTFDIQNNNNKFYQYLRIRKTGPNWFIGIPGPLVLDSIEFYGTLI